jgi:SAM-dependent methyltransferase
MWTRVRTWLQDRRVALAARTAPTVSRELSTYWDRQLTDSAERAAFLAGIGNADAPGRRQVKAHVARRRYRTLLDAGCGPAIDYAHYRGRLRYVALDFADVWRRAAAAERIPFVAGSVEALPFGDRAFDVTYARAVLEHRPYYHDGMRELVRVAAREAIIVFFKVREDHDVIRPDPANGIHHNNYLRGEVEAYATSLPQVRAVRWQDVPGLHHILYVEKA